jgi:hypothetical protein
MTLLRKVFDAPAGLAALASLARGTHTLRHRFLSPRHGPSAMLADVIGVLSITTVASQVLDVVGLYRLDIVLRRLDPAACPRTPSS